MSTAEPGTAPEPPARVRWAPIVFGIVVSLAATAITSSIEPSPGEAGWLRWLRIFAAHPIRGSAAASLLYLAVSPRSPASDGSSGTTSP